MSERMQTVTLVLADGRRLHFSGRYQLDPATLGTLKLVEVMVSEPVPLPEGCCFEALDLTNEGT